MADKRSRDKGKGKSVIGSSSRRPYQVVFGTLPPIPEEKPLVQYTDIKSVRIALGRLQDLCSDKEIRMIANTAPVTCEEAYELIPSLRGREDEIEDHLSYVLAKLAKLKIND